MNTKLDTLSTRFEEPTRFETPVPFRGTEPTALERLRERLLREALAGARGPDEPVLLRRAANEAAALAAITPFPVLFFPTLFEEKRSSARAYVGRQERVRERSRLLLVEAA